MCWGRAGCAARHRVDSTESYMSLVAPLLLYFVLLQFATLRLPSAKVMAYNLSNAQLGILLGRIALALGARPAFSGGRWGCDRSLYLLSAWRHQTGLSTITGTDLDLSRVSIT